MDIQSLIRDYCVTGGKLWERERHKQKKGQYLIEMCYRNDLTLINIILKRKMAQNNLDIKPKSHTTKKKTVPKADRLHHNQEKKH